MMKVILMLLMFFAVNLSVQDRYQKERERMVKTQIENRGINEPTDA